MNLIGLLITIALGLWFLFTVLRKTEEERRSRERVQSKPDRPAGSGRKKMQPADIDRFLEEVNRRRQQASEGKVRPPAKPRAVIDRPPLREPPKPPTKARVTTTKPARVEEELPVAEAVFDRDAPPTAPKWPTLEQPAPATVQVMMDEPALATKQLAVLLQSPQSVRTAMILHEIFDTPKCRRRR